MRQNYVTDAICLKTHNYSESSQILHLLSPEFGAIKGMAKGIRKPKSRLAGATNLFQVSAFQCLEGANLELILQYQPIQSFSALATDLLASGFACGCADVLRWAIPENDPSSGDLFETLRNYLETLDLLVGSSSSVLTCWPSGLNDEGRMIALTVQVLLSMCDELGLAPSIADCAVCHQPIDDDGLPKRFSLPLHGVVHPPCQLTLDDEQRAMNWAKLSLPTWQVLKAPLTPTQGWQGLIDGVSGHPPLQPVRFLVYYLSMVLDRRLPAFDVAFTLCQPV